MTIGQLARDEAKALAQLAVCEGVFDRKSTEALVGDGAERPCPPRLWELLRQQGLVRSYRYGTKERYRLLDTTRQENATPSPSVASRDLDDRRRAHGALQLRSRFILRRSERWVAIRKLNSSFAIAFDRSSFRALKS